MPLATSTIVIAGSPATRDERAIRSPDGDQSPRGSMNVPSGRTLEPSAFATRSSSSAGSVADGSTAARNATRGAVERELGRELQAGGLVDHRARPGDEVDGDEVAVAVMDDDAVRGGPEWRRDGGPARADDEERARHEGEHEQGRRDDERPAGAAARRDRGRDCSQLDPPFGDPPGGSAPRPRGLLEHRIQQVRGLATGSDRFQPGGEAAVGVVRIHAVQPFDRDWPRASASSAVRSARVARWSRDFAVPTGMPRASATSGTGRPT